MKGKSENPEQIMPSSDLFFIILTCFYCIHGGNHHNGLPLALKQSFAIFAKNDFYFKEWQKLYSKLQD